MSRAEHGKAKFLSHIRVCTKSLERLEIHERALGKWNAAINLVAASTLGDFWIRHALDSALLLGLAPESARIWVDLGSGGGFPGAVVAILAQERLPELKVICIESDRRKAAFLRNVSHETGVPFQVLAMRAEDAAPQQADIISARALAPLDKLLACAGRHLSPRGSALFPKGRHHPEELEAARRLWHFDCKKHPGVVGHPGSVILQIEDVRHV